MILTNRMVMPLRDIEYEDLPLIGSKAALLKILMTEEFPVPETLILTGNVYESFISSNSTIQSTIKEIDFKPVQEVRGFLKHIISCFERLKFPEHLEGVLREHLDSIGFPDRIRLAVRPSIIFRESPTKLITRLHQSVLNIDSYSDLLSAIRFVWASNWSISAYEFRRKNRIPHEFMSMAVMLQKMLDFDYSGVCFTTYRNQEDSVGIHAGWGTPGGILHYKVPSDKIILKCATGSDLPIRCEFEREDIVRKDSMQVLKGNTEEVVSTPSDMVDGKILDKIDAVRLGNLTKRVQRSFSRQMKIIWGHDKKSNEIMIVGIENDNYNKPPNTTRWVEFPLTSGIQPLPTPFSASAISDFIDADFNSFSGNLGSEPFAPATVSRTLLGRIFFNLDYEMDFFRTFKIPEEIIIRSILGYMILDGREEVENILSRFKVNLLDSAKMKLWVRKLLNTASDEIAGINDFISEMNTFPFDDVSAGALHDALSTLVQRMSGLQDQSFSLAMSIICMGLTISLRSEDSYREVYKEIPKGVQSFETAYLDEIINLYRQLNSEPWAKKLFLRRDFGAKDLDLLKDTEFYKKLTVFLGEYNYMALSPFEVSSPRICEDPSVVLTSLRHLLRDDISGNFSPAYTKGIPEVFNSDEKDGNKKLGGKFVLVGGWNAHETIGNLLNLMHLSRVHYRGLLQIFAIARKLAFMAGRKLASMNLIEFPSDVYFLKIDEVLSGLERGGTNFCGIVRERKELGEIWASYPMYKAFSGKRLDIFPINLVTMKSEKMVQGIPVYPGKLRGRALKIRTIEDFANMQRDHIPVLESLSAVTAPFLVNSAGVVLERNDPSLKDLILLQRMMKPSISGLPGITDYVGDDSIIEIDGDTGILSFID